MAVGERRRARLAAGNPGWFAALWPGRTHAALVAILVAALLLRVVLIVSFRNKLGYDTLVFISWAHLMIQYGPHHLYAHVDTVSHNPINYPPGYQCILGTVTLVYRALCSPPHQNDVLLGMLLKCPAVVADLVLCVLAYGIVRRWYGGRTALWAAGLAAFSPTTWPLSTLWGQVDSLCAVFMVCALTCCFSRRFTLAWLALGLAILIKPLPVVVAPLLLAAQLRAERYPWRIPAGPVCALALAYIASLPFSPTAAPLGVMRWLFGNYAAGESLTNVTSYNAYNLWTILGTPPSDNLRAFGLTLQAWGWAAFAAVAGATLILYVRRGRLCTDEARWEQLTTRAWFIVLAAFFCLLTRMHERYILYALALFPIAWFCGKVEQVVSVVWITTFVSVVVLVLHFYNHGILGQIPTATYGLAVINIIALSALAAAFFGADRRQISVATPTCRARLKAAEP